MSSYASKHDAPTDADAVGVPVRKRGFAALTPEQRSAISRKGGIAAHIAGNAHEFTSAEGQAAGRKGGHATVARRKAAAEAK
jgi:general stress protein YciG